MSDDRALGATFAPGDILWLDFESRGDVPIAYGADRYSRHARALLLAWAIGDGPVSVTAATDFAGPLAWAAMPADFHEAFARVEQAEMVCCAHNASFDRTIWNQATDGFPFLEPWMIIDSRTQATASGLPAKLDQAAKFAGAGAKAAAGRDLIKLFALPGSNASPESHPTDWQAFIDYAKQDVEVMRALFRRTRQLSLAEWKEYWAAEEINDRGVAIDMHLVEAAAKMAAADKQIAARELMSITDGKVETVDMVKRMVTWLLDVLPADARDMIIADEEEVDPETGEVTSPQKGSLTRVRVQRVLAYLEAHEPLSAVLRDAQRLLQIRLYGGSKTPAKFARMLQMQVDGVIRGQYVFGGASQTGRFSARGVQIHNLMRDKYADEIDAIDALVAGIAPDEFATFGDDTPISRKLSLLIRPSLVADSGHAFVWGDWANIEARLTAWLADDPEADKRLDIFRAVDAGTEKYRHLHALRRRHLAPRLDQVDEAIRQRGKVVELAAGFGGGANALLSMAASYGLHLEEHEAKAAIETWREENPWAPALLGPPRQPRQLWPVGRAQHCAWNVRANLSRSAVSATSSSRRYLGGSLLCRLPSGRWLTYRRIKWTRVDKLDDDGVLVESRWELMFSRDMGRVKLWPGLACENVVQATAADILRGTLARLEVPFLADWMPARLHSHDEIVVQALEADADWAATTLGALMETGFSWTKGLPIAADTTVGRWYTKNKGSMGL